MFIHCTNNCLYVYCEITMSTKSNCCVLICVFTLRKECVYMSGCTIRVFQSGSVQLAYGCIMRYFAVILVSALMMATSSYGRPVVGSSDELLTGLDQVDWKSINNGGYGYVTTTTDPRTGQRTAKVTNPKSPWSADASAKLSSAIGSSSTLPASKPATGYGATGYYSSQPEDTKLTKEEQDQYDFLVKILSPATPNADAKKPTEETEDSMKLTKEEQDKYDWLVKNLSPATPNADTKKAAEEKEDAMKPTEEEQDQYDWRVKNLSSAKPNADAKKPAEEKEDLTKFTKEEQDQYNWLMNNIKPATPEDMQYQSTDTTKPSNELTWRPIFGNRVYTGPTTTTTTGTDLTKPTSTNTLSDTVYGYPAVESDSTSTLTTNVQPTSKYNSGYSRPITPSTYGRKQPSPSSSLYSADLTTDTDSTSRYSAETPTVTNPSKYTSSTTGSVYPSVSSGRYTGGQSTSTYSGPVSPSSSYPLQTATPYKDDDPQTLVLTKDNIDLYFPDNKSPVFRNP